MFSNSHLAPPIFYLTPRIFYLASRIFISHFLSHISHFLPGISDFYLASRFFFYLASRIFYFATRIFYLACRIFISNLAWIFKHHPEFFPYLACLLQTSAHGSWTLTSCAAYPSHLRIIGWEHLNKRRRFEIFPFEIGLLSEEYNSAKKRIFAFDTSDVWQTQGEVNDLTISRWRLKERQASSKSGWRFCCRRRPAQLKLPNNY